MSATMRLTKVMLRRRVEVLCSCWRWTEPQLTLSPTAPCAPLCLTALGLIGPRKKEKKIGFDYGNLFMLAMISATMSWQRWHGGGGWRCLVHVGHDKHHTNVEKGDAEETGGGTLFMLAMNSTTIKLTKVTLRRQVEAPCSCWRWPAPLWGWQIWCWRKGWRYIVHVGNDECHNEVDKGDAEEACGDTLFMLAMTSTTLMLTKVTLRRQVEVHCSCWRWTAPQLRWHWGGVWRHLVNYEVDKCDAEEKGEGILFMLAMMSATMRWR